MQNECCLEVQNMALQQDFQKVVGEEAINCPPLSQKKSYMIMKMSPQTNIQPGLVYITAFPHIILADRLKGLNIENTVGLHAAHYPSFQISYGWYQKTLVLEQALKGRLSCGMWKHQHFHIWYLKDNILTSVSFSTKS